MVTTIGIDPHKATHTAVAIDESREGLRGGDGACHAFSAEDAFGVGGPGGR